MTLRVAPAPPGTTLSPLHTNRNHSSAFVPFRISFSFMVHVQRAENICVDADDTETNTCFCLFMLNHITGKQIQLTYGTRYKHATVINVNGLDALNTRFSVLLTLNKYI